MQIATGIEVTAPVAGAVPEYDQREAARFSLFSWTEYLALPRKEQINVIAYHRAHKLVEAHSHAAVEAAAARQARRAKP